MNKLLILTASILLLLVSQCQLSTESTSLPYLGRHSVQNGDTVYHSIPDFKFVNQDSQQVTPASFADKIYVADFFFTSCPTICPKVAQQMLRIYQKYEKDPRVVLLSHSIDTRHDTIPALKDYASKLGVNAPRWHFVTGDKSQIYKIADDYMSIAKEDANAPGGFDHSGYVILVDRNKHLRSFANGTDPTSVDRFMNDMDRLLKEQYQ